MLPHLDAALAALSFAFLAGTAAEPWTFGRLTDQVVAYCAARPEAAVTAAMEDLWAQLAPGSD